MYTLAEITSHVNQFATANGSITLRSASMALKSFGITIHAHHNDGAMCVDFSRSFIAERISQTHNVYRAADVVAFLSRQLGKH